MEKTIITKETFENLIQMIKDEPILFKNSAIRFSFKKESEDFIDFYLCRNSSNLNPLKYLASSFAINLVKKGELPLPLVKAVQENLAEKEEVLLIMVSKERFIDFFPMRMVFHFFNSFLENSESIFANTVSIDNIIEQLDKIQNETI